jgi:anti-sigma factor RsiW
VEHPPQDVILAFASGTLAAGRRAEVEAHVAICTGCATLCGRMATLEADLRDEFLWRERTVDRLAQALMGRTSEIDREDAEAKVLMRDYAAAPAAMAWSKKLRNKRYRTAGVVRFLTRHAHAICEARPLDALIFAERAVPPPRGKP